MGGTINLIRKAAAGISFFAAGTFLTVAAQHHESMHKIDHVVVGVARLDEGIDQLERLTGVRAEYGGEHPHLGTHNALISLGSDIYLEILAPRPGAELAPSLRYLTGIGTLRPILWAVATDSAEDTVSRLAHAGFAATRPMPGSRKRKDGSILRWKAFELDGSAPSGAPFFIQWGESVVHPAASSPGGCSFAGLEIADPDAERLSSLMETLGLGVSIRFADRPTLLVSLLCSGREVRLGGE